VPRFPNLDQEFAVALRFRPADTTFYDLFAQSARHLVEGAALLAEMLGEGNDREAVAQKMRDAEHRADESTHEIVRRVNTTFVTPFDREDIYALASGLDDVMDFMEEAVDLVLLYEVESLPSELANQVDVLQRCADLTADAMPRLQTMKDLEEYWIEVNRLENAGDKSYRRILAKLFGGKYEALEVLKLKDVVDSLEAAIDAFEKVANIVEQIAVKES
jgi:predicted phosphate transport protein (TIGR00153 family)